MVSLLVQAEGRAEAMAGVVAGDRAKSKGGDESDVDVDSKASTTQQVLAAE